MRLLTAIILACLITGCGGGGSATTSSVVALGDSVTLRTGLCLSTDTLASCSAADRDLEENSYASYIPNVISNQGRGGDTCIVGPAYVGGPFGGQLRGVLNRLQASIALHPTQISLLVGINDLNSGGSSQADTIACIISAWEQIRAAGIEPIALTYGPMTGLQGWQVLNQNIRTEAAKRGIRVVDNETIPGYMTMDGIHPDTLSAKAMAQVWINSIL